MKIEKGVYPLKLEIIDLEEIPDTIDMSIGPPPKKVPEPIKKPKKQDSKTIPLF